VTALAVDASVVLKWVFPQRDGEAYVGQALAVLDHISQGRVSVLHPPAAVPPGRVLCRWRSGPGGRGGIRPVQRHPSGLRAQDRRVRQSGHAVRPNAPRPAAQSFRSPRGSTPTSRVPRTSSSTSYSMRGKAGNFTCGTSSASSVCLEPSGRAIHRRVGRPTGTGSRLGAGSPSGRLNRGFAHSRDPDQPALTLGDMVGEAAKLLSGVLSRTR
jgi:hypothetical protein